MNKVVDLEALGPLQEALRAHPVYAAVQDLRDLTCFMQHHVYAVWDFMSLLKYLQHVIAPAGAPWMPVANPAIQRLINEIVVGEECDEGLPDAQGRPTYVSHFELYRQAMAEVGADADVPLRFLDRVGEQSVEAALASGTVPRAAAQFMTATFGFIRTDKPHVVAAALALGREDLIPGMFRALLARMNVTEHDAPAFHYYLRRHIDLDEGSHGPLSQLMLEELCAGLPERLNEARNAARRALEARLAFWDGVLEAIERNRLVGKAPEAAAGSR